MILISLAKKLNLSTKIIVNFLLTKSIIIENKPHISISEELENLIRSEIRDFIDNPSQLCFICNTYIKISEYEYHMEIHDQKTQDKLARKMRQLERFSFFEDSSENGSDIVSAEIQINKIEPTIISCHICYKKINLNNLNEHLEVHRRQGIITNLNEQAFESSDPIAEEIIETTEYELSKNDNAISDFEQTDFVSNVPILPIPKKLRNSDYKLTWSIEEKFKFFVQKWIQSGQYEYCNHSTLFGVLLGGHDQASQETTLIIDQKRFYFDYKGSLLKKLNLHKVYRDYPQWWNKESKLPLWSEMMRGLSDEIHIQENQISYVKIKIKKKVEDATNKLNLYIGSIQDEHDLNTQLQEEIILKVIKPFEAHIIILEHIVLENKIYFESAYPFKTGSVLTIKLDNAWILKKLRYILNQDGPSENLVWSEIIEKRPNRKKANFAFKINSKLLSNIQKESIQQCLNQDITFIWGPPGTGKTSTLAGILHNLISTNSKTLVCSIANVAVDGILLKLIERLNSLEPHFLKEGNIIRAGSTFSPEISAYDFLFTHKTKIKAHKENLDNLRLKLEGDINEDDRAIALKELKSQREKIKTLQKEAYSEAIAIFCTSAYTLFDETLIEMDFDTLVVDEISMMNIPYLVHIGKFANKRIIVAGDFRQLGPISSAKSYYSEKWMKRDAFKLLSSEYHFEPSMPIATLSEQYRMNQSILDLINPFYNNKLRTISLDSQNKYSNISKGTAIEYIQISHKSKVSISKSGSKYNEHTYQKVCQIVSELSDFNLITKETTIGIITPYREQANKYNLLAESVKDKLNINAGTIHTFQGSESDIIIFDLVEASTTIKNTQNDVSGLFFGQDGERLINVALSRAKSKLFIIGDIDFLRQSKPHLTSKLYREVLKNISATLK